MYISQAMKKLAKKSLHVILKLYEVTISQGLYTLAKKYASIHTKIICYNDWGPHSSAQPNSYKHETNLYNWIYDPSRCEFVLGAALGRMCIKHNDNVLDLCCGDGSYSYLFH